MFKKLADLVIKFRIPIVIFWVAAAIAMVLWAPSLSKTGKMEQSGFLPANTESHEASELISKYFPQAEAGTSGTLVFYDAGGLSSEDMAYARQVQDWLLSKPADVPVTSVTSVFNSPELSSRLVSPDKTTMLMNVGLETGPQESSMSTAVKAIRDHLAGAPQGLEVHVSGAAGIYSDLFSSLTDSIDLTTIITVILVVVLLLAIYRSPVASLVPLFTIGLAYLVSRGVLGLLAQAGVSIWSQIDVFLIVLVFGAGTDYCLFLVSRFREELKRNDTLAQATKATVSRISSVISASAFAVIIGLSGMAVARYQMIKTMGPVLGLAIFITLLAALTLTPALASLFGHKLFWPAHAGLKNGARKEGKGFWVRVAAITTGHPMVVVPVVIALMAVPLLALPGINRSYDQISELPSSSDSTEGYRVLQQHFNEGEMEPLNAIVVAPEGESVTTPQGLAALVELGNKLRTVKGVAQVQSFIQPYGTAEVPSGFTVSGQLTTMLAATSGNGTAPGQANLDPAAMSAGLTQIGTYLTELGQGFAWVKQDGDYLGMQQALGQIAARLSLLQSGGVPPAQVPQVMGEVQQQMGSLAQHGSGLAATFKKRGDPCFLPSSVISSPQTAQALRMMVSQDRQATRVYVVLSYSPQSREALNAVNDVRKEVQVALSTPSLDGYQVKIGGSTASLSDVRTVLDDDFTKVQIVVLCGVFLVFAVLLRSLVAPVYLLLTVLLSYATTLGLVSFIFQGLMHQDGVSFIVPIIVFVLLVALGADYNIFLMSRVREESETKPTRLATQAAAGATGAVITACGIILAGTFAALLVSPLRIMVQVGAAVAIGITLDTFVVRSLLVPAIATLVGRANWWPSKFGTKEAEVQKESERKVGMETG